MHRRLFACIALAALLSPQAAFANVESAVSFKGQTMTVPGALGLFTRLQDCDPKVTNATNTPDRFCHLLDGMMYADGEKRLTFYDLSLLPATSSDTLQEQFITGNAILTQVLEGNMSLAAYGARSVDAAGNLRMLYLPPMTRRSNTVSIAEVRILKHFGANVGVTYIAADTDTSFENSKLYADYIFRLPGTKLLGVYSLPLAQGDLQTYLSARLTGKTEEERLGQLDEALQTYVTTVVAKQAIYDALYEAIHEMLASAQSTPFVDVFPTTTYAEAILAMRAAGVIQGYSDGTFKPSNSVNRAEFMKILLEASGAKNLDRFTAACFPDVDKAQWYAKYVCYAKEKGIVSGYADGTFRPESTINLAETLKIVFKSYNVNVGPTAGEWYQPYLAEARRRGMLVLIKAQVGDAVMRGEMAELMFRLNKSQ